MTRAKHTRTSIPLIAALCVTSFLSTAAAAASERRVALLIGNELYANKQETLKTPKATIIGVREVLQRMRFEATAEPNLTRDAMIAAIKNLASRLRSEDTAVFYFSGHGGLVGQQQYILPVDGSLARLAEDGVTIEWIAKTLGESAAAAVFIVIEACTKTLEPVANDPDQTQAWVPNRTVVVFAAPENQPVQDIAEPGNGRSFFANTVISILEQTCLDYKQAFRLLPPILAIRSQSPRVAFGAPLSCKRPSVVAKYESIPKTV